MARTVTVRKRVVLCGFALGLPLHQEILHPGFYLIFTKIQRMGANLNPFYRFGNKGSELLTNIPKVIIIKETVKIQHEADLSWSLYTCREGASF